MKLFILKLFFLSSSNSILFLYETALLTKQNVIRLNITNCYKTRNYIYQNTLKIISREDLHNHIDKNVEGTFRHKIFLYNILNALQNGYKICIDAHGVSIYKEMFEFNHHRLIIL